MKRQGAGRIINIGSISAQRVRPNMAPYSTSKHGLWGLTQATALEGRPFGISCGCLHPGNVLIERRQRTGRKEDEEPMMTVILGTFTVETAWTILAPLRTIPPCSASFPTMNPVMF